MSENVNKTEGSNNIKIMIFIVIGTIIILSGLFWGFSNRQFVNNAEIAKGVVTKLNAGGSHPEIKFTTNAGKVIEYPQGGLIFGYRTGDEVNVFYDKQNPQYAVVDNFGALWGFPLLSLILGICSVCAGLFSKYS